jgi:preprotein translocase subunit SecF
VKSIFSILGLLIVVAITGFLIKKQFGVGSEISIKPQDGSQISVPTTTLGATAQQQSQQIQQQVKQSMEAAMQQTRPIPDDK